MVEKFELAHLRFFNGGLVGFFLPCLFNRVLVGDLSVTPVKAFLVSYTLSTGDGDETYEAKDNRTTKRCPVLIFSPSTSPNMFSLCLVWFCRHARLAGNNGVH